MEEIIPWVLEKQVLGFISYLVVLVSFSDRGVETLNERTTQILMTFSSCIFFVMSRKISIEIFVLSRLRLLRISSRSSELKSLSTSRSSKSWTRFWKRGLEVTKYWRWRSSARSSQILRRSAPRGMALSAALSMYDGRRRGVCKRFENVVMWSPRAAKRSLISTDS